MPERAGYFKGIKFYEDVIHGPFCCVVPNWLEPGKESFSLIIDGAGNSTVQGDIGNFKSDEVNFGEQVESNAIFICCKKKIAILRPTILCDCNLMTG